MSPEATFLMEIIKGVGTVVAIVAAVYAIRLNRRNSDSFDKKELALAILAIPEVEVKSKGWAKEVVVDKLQVFLNSGMFMSREVQEAENSRINARLTTLEKKVDDLPEHVSDRVVERVENIMIRIRTEK
jgi:hypothetical protein